MVGIEKSLVDLLQRSSLARSILPVQVPCIVVWPPITNTSPLWKIRDDLLASVKRRITHRRLVIAMQLAGLGTAWVGVTSPDARTLTLVGVAATLVGVILALVDKDRLANIDSRTEQLLNEYKTAALEWLRIWLEIGPYAYVNTDASGVTKLDILQDRRHLLTPRVADALSGWLGQALADKNSRTQRWSALGSNLVELQSVDEMGRRRIQQLFLLSDIGRITLLMLLFAVVIAIPTLGIPDVALATVATLVVLTARSANDVALTIFSRPGESSALVSATFFSRVGSIHISDLDETTLERVAGMTVVISRSFYCK